MLDTADGIVESLGVTEAHRQPWWRRMLGPAVGLAVVLGTFGFVLPRVADYASVWATIQTLSWAVVVLLVVVSAWNLASVGPVLMTAFPGLRFWEAMTVAQAGTSVSSALPGGEVVAYTLVYRMYRSFRLSTGEVATGMVVSGMFDNIAKFSMPVIAFVCVRVTGDSLTGLGPVAAIGVGLLIASIVVGIGSLRSEALARRTGDWVGRVTARPLGWISRRPLENFGAQVEQFRRGSIGLLRSRWGLLVLGAYLSELSVYLVLLVSLRLVGVNSHQVSWSVVLASFALVRILQSVPITPGGLGVVELGLTAALVVAGGDHAGVVAGVLVFRAVHLAATPGHRPVLLPGMEAVAPSEPSRCRLRGFGPLRAHARGRSHRWPSRLSRTSPRSRGRASASVRGSSGRTGELGPMESPERARGVH